MQTKTEITRLCLYPPKRNPEPIYSMNEEMQDESKIVANNVFSCKKQTPPPDGGGACVWILNLSLCSSVNALYRNFMRGYPKKSRKAQRKSRERIGARSTPFRSQSA